MPHQNMFFAPSMCNMYLSVPIIPYVSGLVPGHVTYKFGTWTSLGLA